MFSSMMGGKLGGILLVEVLTLQRFSRALLFLGAALSLAGCGGSSGTVTPNQRVAITVQPLTKPSPLPVER